MRVVIEQCESVPGEQSRRSPPAGGSPWLPADREPPSGLFVRRLVGLLVAAVPIATILWIPIAKAPGLGTLSALDVNLLTLWVLVFLAGRSHGRARPPWVFPAVGLALGLCAVLGHALFALSADAEPGSGLVDIRELAVHMKRFGFAAILPVAMSLAAERRLRKALLVTLPLALTMLIVLTLTPNWAGRLAIAEQIDPYALGDRAVGGLSNPNDFGSVAVITGLGILALLPFLRRPLLRSALAVGTTFAMVFAVAISGSRSAALGSGLAVMYLVTTRGATRRRLLLAGVVVLAIGYVVVAGTPLQDRFGSLLSERTHEAGLSSRLEAQEIALRGAAANPLGVGLLNFPSATERFSDGSRVGPVRGSDSFYVDHLLATGLVGAALIVLLARRAWVHVGSATPASSSRLLRAGLVAVGAFGTATLIPASYWVAPFFFLLVGLAGVLKGERRGRGD